MREGVESELSFLRELLVAVWTIVRLITAGRVSLFVVLLHAGLA